VSDEHDSERAHERYRDDLAAYALGALEESEAAALQHHLEGCDECRMHLRWLQPAVDLLPGAVAQLEPPPRLRKRLIATVRAEAREAARAGPGTARRRGWAAFLLRPATALAAGILLVAGAVGGYLLHQPSDPSEFVAQPPNPTSSARGTLESEDGSAILHVEGMPALARDEVYQAWIKRDGALEPSTVFVLQRNRSGEAAISGSLEGADAVLVTKEPSGGSRQPTSDPLLEANLH
jgi:anti-sigma-K factor RskA